MGLDLTFLVATGDPSRADSTMYAHTMLDSRPSAAVVEALFRVEKDKGRDVPDRFMTFVSREDGRDPHYGDTRSTPYGEKIRMVRAKQLCDALAAVKLTDDSDRFHAAVAYLKTVYRDTWVALYWH